MAVVEVENLVRAYGSFLAVRGVSFSIEAGEVVGLLGPNGAGKSTTMKILTGFLAPTAGTATVCGHDVLTDPVSAQEQLGYLPENAPLYAEMQVKPYLEFIGQVRGIGSAELERRIGTVAEECGLTDRLQQRIGTLSRGYRQRVGLAQALLHSPKLLILDEPTNGLDPNQIVEIREIIRNVGRTRTVILSTHILPEVQVTCDRVIIIHEGQLVADGSTESIVASNSGNVLSVAIAEGKVQATASVLKQQLLALDGVTRIEANQALQGEAFRFTVHADHDVRQGVYQWSVTHGHSLVELTAEQRDLEAIFRSLTIESDTVAEA